MKRGRRVAGGRELHRSSAMAALAERGEEGGELERGRGSGRARQEGARGGTYPPAASALLAVEQREQGGRALSAGMLPARKGKAGGRGRARGGLGLHCALEAQRHSAHLLFLFSFSFLLTLFSIYLST